MPDVDAVQNKHVVASSNERSALANTPHLNVWSVLEYLVPVELHSCECVEAIEYEVDALILLDDGALESCGIDPCFVMDPLEF